MKKFILALVALLLTSSLAAQDKTDAARLSSDMRVMLNAIVDMQKAGFYDDKRVLKISAKRLISSLDSLLDENAHYYLPDGKHQANKFARKRAKMIKMYAEDLIVSVDSNNMNEAMDDYDQIIRQCSSCHLRLRKKK